MLKSIEGVYRQGRVELTQLPDNIPDETRVIVTFVMSIYDNYVAAKELLNPSNN